jgi:hypothetical protein
MKSRAAIVTGFLIITMYATIAQAQATRTWISGVGDDVNPCSRTAPCKTWAGAISKTAANGEINVLDPGAFGSVTITKPITLNGGGMFAGDLNAGGVTGFLINTPGANDTVTIRNLEITGATTGLRGIAIFAAKNVLIDNVNIYTQGSSAPNGSGIMILSSGTNVNVSIRNSSVTNNSNHGVYCAPTGGNVNLSISHSRIEQNGGDGVLLVSNCRASVDGTALSMNGGSGLNAQSSTTDANISNSVIAFNTYGVFATSTSVYLFATQVNHNAFPINGASGGAVPTHQNNAVINNTQNGLPGPNVGQQ